MTCLVTLTFQLNSKIMYDLRLQYLLISLHFLFPRYFSKNTVKILSNCYTNILCKVKVFALVIWWPSYYIFHHYFVIKVTHQYVYYICIAKFIWSQNSISKPPVISLCKNEVTLIPLSSCLMFQEMRNDKSRIIIPVRG